MGHYRGGDSRFRQKLFWWHEGYDWSIENPPELKVTGTRLDGPAPPIEMDEHANAGWNEDHDHSFMVAGIFIPTVGCWKETGATLFRTDYGDFEVLFLQPSQTFASVEVIERHENNGFLYTFRGSPSSTSSGPIDSPRPMFFERHANQFFVTSNRQLAKSVATAVR